LHANVDKRNVLAATMIGEAIEFACLDETGLEIEIGLSNGMILVNTE
jgi:hypothetical protein